MRAVVLSLAVLVAGCTSARDTVVRMAVRLRSTDAGGAPVRIDAATLEVRALRLRPCPVPDIVVPLPGVDGPSPTVPGLASPQPWTVGFVEPVVLRARPRPALPLGPWCAMDVVMDGVLRVSGSVPDTGAALTAEVDLPSLTTPFEVAFGEPVVEDVAEGPPRTTVVPLVLELGTGNWLDAVAEELEAGAAVDVGGDDPRVSSLRAGLVVGAALYRDLDGDGAVDEEERNGARVTGLVPL